MAAIAEAPSAAAPSRHGIHLGQGGEQHREPYCEERCGQGHPRVPVPGSCHLVLLLIVLILLVQARVFSKSNGWSIYFFSSARDL
jgi:hypothetical protein